MTAERKTTEISDPDLSLSRRANVSAAPQSLIQVLDQSEQIRDAVEECAVELSTVNSTLNKALRDQPRPLALEAALDQSETVESWMQACASDLSTVNAALKAEIKERHLLEHQLLAALHQEKAARHAAFHDPLTSLPNRVLFNDRLERALIRAQRSGGSLAVMFLDLDGFKVINNTHGRASGDAVLKTLAHRLTALTRNEDTVSRHGDDEFFYLLLELKDEADATLIADKILKSMAQPCFVRTPDRDSDSDIGVNIRLSIGIAILPWDGNTADTLIDSADRAMFRAKQNRSGYAFNRGDPSTTSGPSP